jgi:hypothetical protein
MVTFLSVYKENNYGTLFITQEVPKELILKKIDEVKIYSSTSYLEDTE